MDLGYLGNPAKGYRVTDLLERIGQSLDPATRQAAVLAGAGKLGSALVAYFDNWAPRLRIIGIFDTNPAKIGTDIHGHPCRHLLDLPAVVQEQQADVGIIAVPAEAAFGVARMMIAAGVKGILNFAPVPLDVPAGVYVEQVDLSVSIERVAYMARREATGACLASASGPVPEEDDSASSGSP
jgi:redox-sensing transcriptional repressor